MTTGLTDALAMRLADNLADAQRRNRELKAHAARLHHPRRMSGGVLRCVSCATWPPGADHLRRADWPCETAVAFELDEEL